MFFVINLVSATIISSSEQEAYAAVMFINDVHQGQPDLVQPNVATARTLEQGVSKDIRGHYLINISNSTCVTIINTTLGIWIQEATLNLQEDTDAAFYYCDAPFNPNTMTWNNQIAGTDDGTIGGSCESDPIANFTSDKINTNAAYYTLNESFNEKTQAELDSGDGVFTIIGVLFPPNDATQRNYQASEGTPKKMYFNMTCDDEPPGPPGLLDSSSWCTSCSPAQQITNQPWKTSDGTPTVNATMNISATCAIVANNTNVGNYNYTDIKTNYGGVDCSTTGGINQICTVSAGQLLSTGENRYISIGCKSANGNELLNATLVATMNITETTNPECTYIAPDDNNWTSTDRPIFSVNCTDNYATTLTAILYIDNLLNNTGSCTNITSCDIQPVVGLGNFTISTWNISCTDTHANAVNCSPYRTIYKYPEEGVVGECTLGCLYVTSGCSIFQDGGCAVVR